MADDKKCGNVILGKCTWRYAFVDGMKTDILDAVKGCSGICPICGELLIPRKGKSREWHWWHKKGRKCDAWYEPKGEWHRWWQNHFAKEWQEVVLPKEKDGEGFKHIADVYTPDKWAMEFQYSHLSLTDISAREQFYGDMFWIVNGTRLRFDSVNGERWKRREVKESYHGFNYFHLTRMDVEDVNDCWRDRNKIVFFDFDGTFDEPKAGADLFCLLPGEVCGSRLVVRLSQDEFVANVRNQNVKDFVDRLLSCKEEYDHEYQILLRHAKMAEERRRQEEEERLLKAREEARRAELANPAAYGVTCGWVEALAIVTGKVDSLVRKDWNLSKIPERGKAVLHLAKKYTRERFWKDKRISWDLNIRFRVPEFEKLQKCAGMAIAKLDYSTYYDDGKSEWILVIGKVEPLKNFEGDHRCVYDIKDKDGVWELSEALKVAVNDRKYKQVRKLRCPVCGAEMVIRSNKSNRNLFYGCTKYPECNCTMSCGSNGQLTVSDVYWNSQFEY